MNKKLIDISNLQKFLSKLNEKFALKKAMKGISEDEEGNIIIGEEGLVPAPDEKSKGKFLRSDGTWSVPGDSPLYDSMSQEEGIAGVSEVDRVINAKNLKQIVNSDGFLTSLDSSKLTGIINIENLPQGALERILIVSSKEERLKLLETEVQLGDVVKEADTGLMYYVIDAGKLNSEEGYTQFTAGSASSVPWSGVTDKPTIPTKTSDLTNDSDFAIDNNVVHKSGNESITGIKTFTSTRGGGAVLLFKPDTLKKGDTTDGQVSRIYHGDAANYANALHIYETGTTDNGDRTYTNFVTVTNTAGISNPTNRTTLTINFHKNPSDGRKQTATLSGDFLPFAANTYNLGSESNPWDTLQAKTGVFTQNPMRKVTDYAHGETISSEYKGGGFQIVDKNNISMGILESYYWKNGYNNTYLSVYNQDPNNRKSDRIGIAYDTTRDIFFGFCPTPPKSENSNAIATTEWVTAKGYLTSHQSLSNYSTLANTVKSISISGKTITVTLGSGDAYTLTTQDTNTWTAFKGATSSANGTAGYVPAPTKGNQDKFFKADGTWATPTNTTYSVATTSANGLMSSTDKKKLDGLSNYTLPTGAKDVLGGVKTTSTVTSTSGLTASPIIDGVVYYKDTNTTYASMSASEATTGAATTARTITAKVLNDKINEKIGNFETKSNAITGLSVSGKVITYTKGDGSTGTITTQDTNTDTKVTNTLGNTTKAYITGTTSAKTNTGTQIFDSGVYLTTTAGQLHADIDFPITEAQVNEILGIA